MSGVKLCRRLEKRNLKTIAAGLITVGYIVTFHLLGKQASPRATIETHDKDYINTLHHTSQLNTKTNEYLGHQIKYIKTYQNPPYCRPQ